jgi:hypothetical protein
MGFRLTLRLTENKTAGYRLVVNPITVVIGAAVIGLKLLGNPRLVEVKIYLM